MNAYQIDGASNKTELEIQSVTYVVEDTNGENQVKYRNLTNIITDIDGKKILSLPATSVGKTFYIEISFKTVSGKYITKQTNKIEVTKNPNSISITQNDAFKNALPLTKGLNGMLTFNQADVDYVLEYDNVGSKWIAKDSQGTIFEKDIAIDFVSKDALKFISVLDNGVLKFDDTVEITSKYSSSSPQYRIEATVTVGNTSEKIQLVYQLLDVIYEKVLVFSEQSNLDNTIAFIGENEEYELKYADGKYSIFKSGTTELISEVEVSARTYSFWGSGSPVTLTDGAFAKTGKYVVNFKFKMYGLSFNHTQYVTYK